MLNCERDGEKVRLAPSDCFEQKAKLLATFSVLLVKCFADIAKLFFGGCYAEKADVANAGRAIPPA